MSEYIHPSTLAAALSLGPLKGNKARVVMLIGSYPAGRRWSGAEVGEWLGLDAGTARRHLDGLARDRILLRDGGGGSRASWTMVNPDVLAWRGIHWPIERPDLERRLVLNESRLAQLGECATTAPWNPFAAQFYGARQTGFAAQSYGARQGGHDDRLSRKNPPFLRDNGAPDELVAHHRTARQNPARRAEPPGFRAAIGPPEAIVAQPRASSSVYRSSSSTEEEEEEALDHHLDRVSAAIIRRCGPHAYLEGKPERALRGLIQRYGVGGVLEELNRTPNTLPVPVLVKRLATVLNGHAAPDPAEERRARRAQLESRLAGLHRQYAAYEADGAGEPELESLRIEVVACETELAAVDQEERTTGGAA